MSKVDFVIGVDPASTKGHALATYKNGKLVDLRMSNLMDSYEYLKELKETGTVKVHIEAPSNNKAVWHANGDDNSKKSYGQASQRVAMCKWAQIEFERMCDHIGVSFKRHRNSSKWKKPGGPKNEFERVTGWKGRTNEDKRSAAWFGYIGVTR